MNNKKKHKIEELLKKKEWLMAVKVYTDQL